MIVRLILSIVLFFRLSDGANITATGVPSGHWRLSTKSETLLRCPFGEIACEGGSGAQAGDFLCSHGFSGLLCAIPSEDHFIDWASQDSLQCDDSIVLTSFLIPILVLLSMLFFICRNVGLKPGVRQLRELSLFRRSLGRSLSSNYSSGLSVPTQDSVDPGDDYPGGEMIGGGVGGQGGSSNSGGRGRAVTLSLHRPHSCTFIADNITNNTNTNNNTLSPHTSTTTIHRPTTHTITAGATNMNTTFITDSAENNGEDTMADANMDRLHKLKIFIFTLQICSSLPSVLHTHLGHYLSALLRYGALLGVTSLSALPWGCYSSTLGASLNLLEQMQTATVLPLAGVLVVVLVYALHMEVVHLLASSREAQRRMHDRYTRKYGTGLFLMLYISQGGVWQLLSSVLFSACVQTDPDGTVVQGSASYRVMLADVSIQCDSSSYRFGYLWAMVAAIVYACTVPMLELLLVYMYSDLIALHDTNTTTNGNTNTNATTSTTTTTNTSVDVLKKGFSSKYSMVYSSSSCDSSSDSSDSDVTNTPTKHKALETTPHCIEKGLSVSSKTTSVGVNASTNHTTTTSSKKNKEEKKYSVLRKRNTAHYFGAIGLLYQAYTTQRWYWGIVDSGMRMFYMALLPALFPYASNVQFLLAIAATLLFITIQQHYRPYTNPANQLLAQCALVQVLLLVVGGMGLQLHMPDIYIGELHVYDGLLCVINLSTPLLCLYQVFCTPYGQTDTTTNSKNVPVDVVQEPAPPSVPRRTPRRSRSSSRSNVSDSNSNSSSNSSIVCKHRRQNGANSRRFKHSRNRYVAHKRSSDEYDMVEHKEQDVACNNSNNVHTANTTSPYILSTPPRNTHRPHAATSSPTHGTTIRNTTNIPAIPTMFTHHTDLAMYTNETITYDQLSAEKAQRLHNSNNISMNVNSSVYGDREGSVYSHDTDSMYSGSDVSDGEDSAYSSDAYSFDGSSVYSTHTNNSTYITNENTYATNTTNIATSAYNDVPTTNHRRPTHNTTTSTHNTHHTHYPNRRIYTPSPESTPPQSDIEVDEVVYGRHNTNYLTHITNNLNSTQRGSWGSGGIGINTHSNYHDNTSPNHTTNHTHTSTHNSTTTNSIPIWHSMFEDHSEDERCVPPLPRAPRRYHSGAVSSLYNVSSGSNGEEGMITTGSNSIYADYKRVDTAHSRVPPTPLNLTPLGQHSTHAAPTTPNTSNNITPTRTIPKFPSLPTLPTNEPMLHTSNTISKTHSDYVRVENKTPASVHGIITTTSSGVNEVYSMNESDASGDQPLDVHNDVLVPDITTAAGAASSSSEERVPACTNTGSIITTNPTANTADEGIDSRIASIFGNNRSFTTTSTATANTASTTRTITPVYQGSGGGVWGMLRRTFGTANSTNIDTTNNTTATNTANSTRRIPQLLTTTSSNGITLTLNDIDDGYSSSDSSNSSSDSDSHDTNTLHKELNDVMETCYTYSSSANFTESVTVTTI